MIKREVSEKVLLSLNSVSDIMPSIIAKVISPSCQRNIAKGNMLIEPSKLRDNNTFSDTSLFIIALSFV